MKAEIINIGDEILIGQIVNTNSSWMAMQLSLAGVRVVRMLTVSDDDSEIRAAMENSLNRADIVLITGGLGPTKDDVTKKTFSSFFEKKLVSDPAVEKDVIAFFEKRNKPVTQLNLDQALVPEGCDVIRNANGTAPGMWMKKENTVYVSMPGVPYEMQGMMTNYVVPRIKKDYRLPVIYHKSVLTEGLGESSLAEKIEKWEDQLASKNIKLAYLPKPGMVRLRLSTTGEDEEQVRQIVDSEINSLKELISEFIYGYEEFGKEQPSLEKIVSDLLRGRKQTLSLAESCTGGYITSLITALPGASEILKGAIVPYTNEAKTNLAEVDPGIFEKHGAVSRECVEALAVNVRKKFKSDYSIAVSGIAGPAGGTNEKPVGMVWVAYADAKSVYSEKFQFGSDRGRNIQMTGNSALSGLRKILLELKSF